MATDDEKKRTDDALKASVGGKKTSKPAKKAPKKEKDPLAAALGKDEAAPEGEPEAPEAEAPDADAPAEGDAASDDGASEGRSDRASGVVPHLVDDRKPLSMKESTNTPDGKTLKAREGGEGPAPEVIAQKRPKQRDASIADAVGARAGAPLDDARFLERARRREERARRMQAREEAKQMREEAKRMMAEAKKRERAQGVLEAHMEKVANIGAELGYDPERPITRIPELPEHMEEVSFREIEKDRAYIRMAFDKVVNSYEYQVIEPTLTDNEEKIMAFLRDTLIRTLDGRRAQDVDWAQYLRDAVQQAIVDHDILVDQISTERILYYLIRDFLGFGPIDVLMQDEQLEDISCDGPGIPIYVFHRQHESVRTNIKFADDLEIDSFVIRLAQRSGKHISIADPLLDATLPDGSRLQATLSREVTSRGSSFTIRKFREEPFTPTDLINYATISAPMSAYFWFIMEEGRSLIYAGGTASGKTTSLNACCQYIPPEKKIVSIEDTREMNLMHENWIAGVTRTGFGGENIAGKRAGAIDMYRLLEAALRQRPEYLIVGEVRGSEALTLFQAMATGHAVYSTMHADSAKSAVYRLENPPINVPRMMLQTLDTICIQSQVKVGNRMARRVKEVVEIIGFDPDTEDLLTNTVFYWDPVNDRHVFTGHSGVFDQIQDKKGWSDAEFQKEWERRMLVLEWMRHNGVNHFHEFSKVIHEYYQRPDNVLRRIEEEGFELDKSVSQGNRAGNTTAMYEHSQGEEDAERLAPWQEGEEPDGDLFAPGAESPPQPPWAKEVEEETDGAE